MRAFTIICLAVLVAIGQALEAPGWVRAVGPTLDDAVVRVNAALTARSPRRGGGSSGGGGGDDEDDDDDDDDDSSSGGVSCTPAERESMCGPTEQICGDSCISATSTCCGDDRDSFCKGTERCVPGGTLGSRMCCPIDDLDCNYQSGNSTFAFLGTPGTSFAGGAGCGSAMSGASRGLGGGIGAVVVGGVVAVVAAGAY